ncbi:signal peptidase I [Halorubrum sp. F4]|uniref:signal peptidase I n=1 Tax=Halorubrum sp. F4 TaxID=2989715 RepID=UPI0024812DF2|nr:signal peptidase I [Halorubrum sp. F4]
MSVSLPERRRVLDWAGLLLLIALVVPFVVYAVPGVVGAQGGYVVLSGSMEPSIGVGDVVIVDDVTPAEIEEGDVITYLRGDADTPTTHRVVEVTERNGERAFITQGDANEDPDAAPVPASRVLGEVAVVIPYMGYVIEFVNTPTGFLALVVIPFVLLALSEVRSVIAGDDSGPTEGALEDEGSGETGDSGGTEGSGEIEGFGEIEDSGEAGENDGDSAEIPPMGPFETAAVDDSESEVRANEVTGASGESSASVDANEDAAASGEAIAITRTDLRLSGLVLTGTTGYAGWVVYHVQTAWSFAAAFGSGFGLLLVAGMYYAAGGTDPESGHSSSGDDPDRVGDRSPKVDGRSRETRSTGVIRADGEGDPSESTEDLGIENARDSPPSDETPTRDPPEGTDE